MNKLTAEQIIERLEEIGVTPDVFAHEEFDYIDDEEIVEQLEDNITLNEKHNWVIDGIGEMIEVDSYGGEGKGDTWYSVKYFPDHDVYIRIDGWYSSYHGVDFEDGLGREVRPEEKVITVYE